MIQSPKLSVFRILRMIIFTTESKSFQDQQNLQTSVPFLGPTLWNIEVIHQKSTLVEQAHEVEASAYFRKVQSFLYLSGTPCLSVLLWGKSFRVTSSNKRYLVFKRGKKIKRTLKVFE